MQIKQMLLLPQFKRVGQDLIRLNQEMDQHDNEAARSLQSSIQKKSQELEKLISGMEGRGPYPAVSTAQLNRLYREIKLQSRFAQRKWKCLVTSEARVRRNRERRRRVSTFAA